MNDLSKEWKVDTMNLLRLLLEGNPKGTILSQPVRLFQNLLKQLVERGLELNDSKLNEIMQKLCLIEPGGTMKRKINKSTNKCEFYCDRCDKKISYENETLKQIYVKTNNKNSKKMWDLCDRCFSLFERNITKREHK